MMYDYVPFNETNNIIKHWKSVASILSCINHQTRSAPKCHKTSQKNNGCIESKLSLLSLYIYSFHIMTTKILIIDLFLIERYS